MEEPALINGPTCRVCLEVRELMVHIYEESENLSTLLEQCGGLKVEKTDNYPKYLCNECTSELLIAAKFREKCARTQKILDQSIAMDRVFKEEPSTIDFVPYMNTTTEVMEGIAYSGDNSTGIEEILEEVGPDENLQTDSVTYIVEEVSINNTDFCADDIIVEDYEDNETIENIDADCSKSSAENDSSAIPPQFICDVCGAVFVQAANLKRHMDRTHIILQSFTCAKCSHYFSLESDFEKHRETCKYGRSFVELMSGKEIICGYCSRVFSSTYALTLHTRTHTGERPYVCDVCHKAFKTQSAVRTHLKRHKGESDYICSVCGKSFYESSNLVAHMRTHTGEKPHACSICSKRFSRVFLLQLHMRTHTGEKPYQCVKCERAFAQLCDLKNHERTHDSELRYKCSLCNKTFAKRHSMTVHLDKHKELDASRNTVQSLIDHLATTA